MEKPFKEEDESPPGINDHPFEPRGEWWSLCKHCGLARASHSSSTIDVQEEMIKEHIREYGYVQFARRQDELRRISRGDDRVQIAYFSEDNPDEE